MGRVVKERSVKSVLPPWTLIHIGEKTGRGVRVMLAQYGGEAFDEREMRELDEPLDYKDPARINWVSVEGLHDVELIKRMGEYGGLHPLVLEDILNTDQRPKLEDYGEYLYIVMKMFRNGVKNEVTVEQLSLIL